MRRARLLGAAVAALVLLTASAPAAARDKWDTKVLAKVPSPGFPARAYVHPNGTIYAGTYVNPNGDALQSKVFEFARDGELLRTWTIPGQDLNADHGVQVATSDAQGRLILLDRTPARALVLDPRTAEIRTYARFPDLPGDDAPPFANYAAWGPGGELYVTDYEQGVVWKVPPGGGTPTVWLKDPKLDGGPFGTAGIVLAADRRTLLLTQASGLGFSSGNPATGRLYAVPIKPDGSPGALQQLWESAPTDLPDGFAIARSGNVYIANVGLTAQIAVVGPDGQERDRFPDVPGLGLNGSDVPFDSPSSAWFAGTSIIVANQSAIAGNTGNQVLFDIEVGETGLPEHVPPNAGFADARLPGEPQVAAVTPDPLRRGKVRRRGGRWIVTLTRGVAGAPARVRLTANGRTLATGTLRGRTLTLTPRRGARPAGTATIRPLKPGRRGLRPALVRLECATATVAAASG